jgi:biotin operon repressor
MRKARFRRVNRGGLIRVSRALAVLCIASLMTSAASAQEAKSSTQNPGNDWKQVEDAMGRPGQVTGDVIRFGMPRKDLHVTLNGVAIKPGLALGSWTAFKRLESGAMVMGDLVLTEDEVEPVMRKLQESGIEVAAVHNHLIGESPHVMYMHLDSHGDAVKMAQTVRDALALTKTPGPDAGGAAPSTEALGIDQKKIEDILGHTGKVNGGILQISVPRAETITESAMVVPPSMGVATALNFQPTGNAKAAITGDFVLTGKEVNPVMKALRENGIEVTAVHSHMLTEEPRLFFMHFWANDDAAKLAKGLRAALDLTNSKK